MVGDGNGQMGFQHGSESMFDSSNRGGKESCYGSGWDPIVPLSQDGNLGSSMMVSHANLGNPSYPIVPDSKLGLSGASQFMHYLSDASVVEMLPKFPGFGGGGFPGIGNSYCLPGYAEKGENPSGVLSKSVMTENATMGSVQSHEDPQVSEERSRVASPNGKRKRNVGRNTQRDSSGEISEIKDSDEKKQKVEESGSSDQSNKQMGRQTKDNCSAEEDSKGYIHVRARRGQATNSHSLAERVRREKINERMKLLQELVPGCSKITGKALMLDEIINYVQSLQQQVEFLSMKLANVNPELNFNVDQILSKDILHSRGMPGFNPGTSFAHLGAPVIANTTSPYHPIPQGMWDGELQTLHHMGLGFELNPTVGNLGSNGTQ